MPNAFTPDEHKLREARSLLSAVADGDAATVAALLTKGARVDSTLSPGGETPLMRAATLGYAEVVRVLLDAGADLNAQRADGFTSLILAVFFGHEMVVRLLIERGADASAQTRLGMTAARWAAARGFAEMAGLLRSAEAARPRVNANVSRAKAAPLPVDDEVRIFSRKAGQREAQAAVVNALAVESGGAGESTANVSLRRGAKVPAHPSASTFRLGHFLSSWQGSVGTALLLLAFGVGVFALWRGGTNAREVAQPAPSPSPTAPQTAAQPVAPSLPAPQPSPVLPTPDAQGLAPLTDPAYAAPNTAGQPFYVPPGAASPVQSNAPRELVVVSESGASSGEDAGRPKRKTEAGANDAASGAAQSEGRDEPGAAEDSRAGRSARTPDTEQHSAPPARSSTPPLPAPTPAPTPGRGKVIQWPPQ
jgi:hypothetical protein